MNDNFTDVLPDIDHRKTQIALESAFARYRLFKYMALQEQETSITASYEERFHGPTNETSDQTARAAINNVHEKQKREAFCQRLEKAVERLPSMEGFLIRERYLSSESEYMTDINMYTFKFDPPISQVSYMKIRKRAFYKLGMALNVAVRKRK